MKLTLIEKRQELETIISFIFKTDPPLSWKAGQFIRYHIEDPHCDERKQDRYFTIASAPYEKNIMLTTKVVPDDGSSFKKDLMGLSLGDVVEATGPGGQFVVEDPIKQYVFIAGGIGITPFRSIILSLDYNQNPINVTLLYANRTPDFIFKEELENVRAKHPEFKIEYFVDPARIDEQAINSLIINRQSLIYYVSGPEPMVEAMEKMLYGMGIPKEQVKRDYFPGYTWP